MSDQVESRETVQPGAAAAPDPVTRALDEVAEAMAQARAAEPPSEGAPTVPSDDEVAGLERAHEALRSTLDRAERSS